jgi:hypothetical protein
MSQLGKKTLRIAEVSVCVCLAMAAERVAEAQQGQALPVAVSFDFTAPQVVSFFDDLAQRKQIEQQINSQFITRLQSRFHYWTFTPISPAVKVTLKLGLRDADADTISLWAALFSGAREIARWEKVVFPPGDLIRLGMPTGKQWLATLPAVFDDGLLQKHSQEILDALKGSAPVGKDITLMPSAADPDVLPRAVLALDSSQYDDLQDCEFRLRYDWSAGGKVTIHSSGISMHAPFAPSTPPFDGIVVQLEQWQQGNDTQKIGLMRNHLLELTPVEFYLEAIKGPGSD